MSGCERLVDDAALLVHRITGARPQVHVLATSREPLGLAAEVIFPVHPLDEAAAVRLFLHRARSADPGFAVPEADAETVAEICRRIDGVPLAVELAAPWVRLFSRIWPPCSPQQHRTPCWTATGPSGLRWAAACCG